MRRTMKPVKGAWPTLLALAVVVVVACGPTPLDSLGSRSSAWINEPTVPSTQPVTVTTPTVVPAERLLWANDVIETANISDRGALLAEIFERREGDSFIQASRQEIAVALPDVTFPSSAPPGAEWVSSQLVFENDGTLAADPSAAFGIWSAEPYTRSRSVAQMIVMRVSNDEEAATALASGAEEPTCARFSDRESDECEVITIGERATWLLVDSGGTTLIWFEGPYRYELFGRSFVSEQILQQVSGETVPLTSLETVES